MSKTYVYEVTYYFSETNEITIEDGEDFETVVANRFKPLSDEGFVYPWDDVEITIEDEYGDDNV